MPDKTNISYFVKLAKSYLVFRNSKHLNVVDVLQCAHTNKELIKITAAAVAFDVNEQFHNAWQ